MRCLTPAPPGTITFRFLFVVCLTLASISRASVAQEPQVRQPIAGDDGSAESAQGGMIATVDLRASKAGALAYNEGGNAVDAAVAAALTLGVIRPDLAGIGGGCFILVRTPDGKFVAIDGRETAPAQATRNMYLRDGKADPSLSQSGPLAVATPSALAAYEQVLKDCGRRSLADALWPGYMQAKSTRLSYEFSAAIRKNIKRLQQFGDGNTFLHGSGPMPLKPGDELTQHALLTVYRQVAKEGTNWFYRGPFAQKVGDWMKKNGGVLSVDDFKDYRVVYRQPVITSYKEYTVVGFPPPSSGGVHVGQILNILENFDLRKIRQENEADYIHVVAEAMKLAFADRAHWLGDPAFAKVPQGLLDQEYADRLANNINVEKAADVARHGEPPQAGERLFGAALKGHTTHVAAADQEGWWVAITATNNTSFGSAVVVPGTGVVLNNQMDDFAIAPGVPNAFGLIGAEANAVAAGKRPLSSMSPTIVLKEGEPVLTLGAAGGPRIITEVVLAILNHLEFGMTINEAVAAPRFHHQWRPNVLFLEPPIPLTVAVELQQGGHQVQWLEYAGVTQAISLGSIHPVADQGGPFALRPVNINGVQKVFVGVHDPRVQGSARPLGKAHPK